MKPVAKFICCLIVVAIATATVFFILKNENNDVARTLVDNYDTYAYNNDGRKMIFSRSASTADIKDTYVDNDLSNLKVNLRLITEVDISNLRVQIFFLNNKGQIIDSVKKYLGNVKRNEEVVAEITLSDLLEKGGIDSTHYSFAVIGGTVSCFA